MIPLRNIFAKCYLSEMLPLRNVTPKKCYILEMLTLRNATFKKCYLHEMLPLRNVTYMQMLPLRIANFRKLKEIKD